MARSGIQPDDKNVESMQSSIVGSLVEYFELEAERQRCIPYLAEIRKAPEEEKVQDNPKKHLSDEQFALAEVEKNIKQCLISVKDYEELAISKLSAATKGYIIQGADNNITLNRNIQAFNNLMIMPRHFRGQNTLPDTGVNFQLVTRTEKVVEQKYEFSFKMPVGISPALYGIAVPPEQYGIGEELLAAQVANRVNVPMIVPMLASDSLEDVIKAADNGAVLWFQFYWLVNDESTMKLVRRAERAGYSALVLTCDVTNIGKPRSGEDIRNESGTITFPNLKGDNYISGLLNGPGTLDQRVSSIFAVNLDWTKLRTLIQTTKLPVIVKGIVNADDAKIAVECGASGVLVSNSGGRCLDESPATIQVLPGIISAVRSSSQPDTPVFMDGGIRSGRDVLKAIGCGASMVFVGRPVIYGMITNGYDGAVDIFDIFYRELMQAMQYSGVKSVDELRTLSGLVVHVDDISDFSCCSAANDSNEEDHKKVSSILHRFFSKKAISKK